MSKRSAFDQQVTHAADQAGGSFDTRQNRREIARRFAIWCWRRGYQLQDVASIKVKHIKEYVDDQLNQGKSGRSIQNELAAIRKILRHLGRKQFADSRAIGNASLGISGTPRAGTKTALPDHLHQSAISGLLAGGEDGIAIVLSLERFLGLRGEEAIRSVPSLKTWIRSLPSTGKIRVVYGTKGGRPRDTRIPSALVQSALSAIDQAIDYTGQNDGKLIPGTLKMAQSRYHRAVRSVGLIGECAPHSERYWFAARAFEGYRSQGFSEKEALAMVSMDLGHGDGRGRWVKSTYYQRATGDALDGALVLLVPDP